MWEKIKDFYYDHSEACIGGGILTVLAALIKPRPSPPKWFFYDNDDCWDCKNRNGCNGCKRLKKFRRKHRDKKNEQV